MICIGGSSGSIDVMHDILGGLPTSFDMPIAIVLHRHKNSGDVLKRLLRSPGMPSIIEPYDKENLSNGAIYLAPADYHMLVDRRSIRLSVDPPVVFARPSIDVLFESAAQAYRQAAIGIILSGASEDGASGAQQIHREGGYVIVQDPASAKVSTMPRATMESVSAARVMDVRDIIEFLRPLLRRERHLHE